MTYSPRHARSRAAPQTHEQRLAVLDALDHAELVGFVANKAKLQDMAWLRTLLDDGAFDVPANVHLTSDISKQDRLHTTNGLSLVNALAGVIETAKIRNDADRTMPPTLAVSDEFKSFFWEVTQRMVGGFQQALHRARTDGKPWTPAQKGVASATMDDTLGVLLIAACAMDHGDSVRHLASPKLARDWVNLDWLGTAGIILDRAEGESSCNAPLVAILFSAHNALDALRETGCQAAPMVWYSTETDIPKIWDQRLPLNEDGELNVRVGLLSHLLANGLRPSASMIARAIEETKVDGAFHEMDAERFYGAASDALVLTSPADLAKVTGFLSAGVYDIHPAWAIESALIRDRTEVLDHFAGREPWDDMFPVGEKSVLTNAMQNATRAQNVEASGPLFARLMKNAEAAGFGDRLYSPEAVNRDVEIAVRHGYMSVLLAHLEHGLDGHAKLGDAPSALEIAKQFDQPAVAHMIHAHAARGAAHDILDELRLSPFVSRAAP